MHQDIAAYLLSKEEIADCVARLGAQITTEYQGRPLLVVGVLNGAAFFTTDLARAISFSCRVDFIGASSYGNTTTSGKLTITKEPSVSPKGMDVLLVEDVLDTGRTLQHLKQYYLELGAASVKLCVMVDKPAAHCVPIQAEYVGIEAGNEFIVGYGLDYAQQYRNLPYIGILKPEIYGNPVDLKNTQA